MRRRALLSIASFLRLEAFPGRVDRQAGRLLTFEAPPIWAEACYPWQAHQPFHKLSSLWPARGGGHADGGIRSLQSRVCRQY